MPFTNRAYSLYRFAIFVNNIIKMLSKLFLLSCGIVFTFNKFSFCPSFFYLFCRSNNRISKRLNLFFFQINTILSILFSFSSFLCIKLLSMRRIVKILNNLINLRNRNLFIQLKSLRDRTIDSFSFITVSDFKIISNSVKGFQSISFKDVTRFSRLGYT